LAKAERQLIAAEEARKARLALGNDLDQRTKEIAYLTQVIAEKNTKHRGCAAYKDKRFFGNEYPFLPMGLSGL
jgi:hypothetical protein